jgi:transposase
MDASEMTPAYRLFVGVDIAAATATVAWRSPEGPVSRPITIDQTPRGFAVLQERLRATGSAPQEILVVLEATGPYWVALATSLTGAGVRVSVVNPAQAHHFAKALLKRAKTDAIDARTLAELAARMRPAPWTPPPAIHEELRQRLAQRDSLIALRQQVRGHLHALDQAPVVVASVRARLEELIAVFAGQIAALERELAGVLEQDDAWAEAIRRLQTIPGVGMITAAWLVVGTQNFALCADATQATAYAGLAPMPRESGTSVRGRARIGHAGNRRLRTALYLATLSAGRVNPAIRPFYERLRAAGKPMKVARCAAARKLLHLAWAVGCSGQAFDPDHRRTQPHSPSAGLDAPGGVPVLVCADAGAPSRSAGIPGGGADGQHGVRARQGPATPSPIRIRPPT